MDVLSDVLALLKLQGTLYFRTAFNPPWGILVPSHENVARFHLVLRGRCWLAVSGVEAPLLLEQGDLVIVTHGAEHSLCDPADTPVKTVDQVVTDAGFTGEGTLVYGAQASGHDTQLVCGHFAFDRNASHPLIEALPPYISIKQSNDAPYLWLESTLKLIGAETGQLGPGSDLIVLKLSEIIFAQAIRAYLASEGQNHRVFKGLADPPLNRALQALHRDPAAPWTLDQMAKTAGLSRTAFAKRFHERMGLTPMHYLTAWRMQLGRKLLAESDVPVFDVAEQSGYHSEAAFGRVFKRHFGLGPAGYRRQQRGAAR